jgi:CoA:oxalate CoA-transferase
MMALSGVRVVDLTRIVAGPFCSALLADMGADVVKIEPPGSGDPVREQGAIRDGLSWYFAQFNRNKRSLTLDLYSAEGKAVLADLLANADILVENYRPGVLARMGFDNQRLEDINPRLIVTSINGYGSTGPYADRPSFDFIAQAMSGFMGVNGDADGPPMRAGPPMSDLIAGLYAAFGAVCALNRRDRDGAGGTGQHVEASLVNGLVSMMAYLSAEYFATGKPPARAGNDHPIVAPYGLFAASDGNVAVAASNDVIVRRFLEALGLAHLLDQPDYADNTARMANRPRLHAMVNERIGAQTVDHWIDRLNGAGVPCGRVMSLDDVFNDPQVLAQEMVLDVDHPGHGSVRMTGFPVKLDATPARLHRPAPELGADSEAVLRELGYDTARIAALREAGTI